MDFLNRIRDIFIREIRGFSHRPLFLFCMVVAPLVCAVFFVTLMDRGLPSDLPAGIVDMDNTNISRTIVRTVDAMENANFTKSYSSFSEAKEAMQRGEIYAFFYIPAGTTAEALANRQPTISFYTNESYFVPGSLLMKDFRTASELAGLALTRETLYARGATEKKAMGIIQPITIETHPLNNPTLDYSVYLNNIIVPGILILLIMLSTSYTVGVEWKSGRQRELYSAAGNSSTVALVGKLLPQTLWFTLVFIFYDVYFYKIMGYPCNVPIWHMMLLGFDTVVASQAFGVFFLRSISRPDANGYVSVLFMGNTVFLRCGIYISGHCNVRLPTETFLVVPVASLLPHLCQSGFERVFDSLRLAFGGRSAVLSFAPDCRSSAL